MERTYFKGLDKALDENCYIIMYNTTLGNVVVRVEKKNTETGKVESVLSVESGNAISALNKASSKIVGELGHEKDNIGSYECTLIDRVLESGYTLHFYKLPDEQVLSTIGCYGDITPVCYIPVKSIMSNDIRTGFELLNASLEYFNVSDRYNDFNDAFYNFVKEQTISVKACQRVLKPEMEDICFKGLDFKGLDKALDDNCYIEAFYMIVGPIVRVMKKNRETGKEELVSLGEHSRIISALNTASYEIDNLIVEEDNYMGDGTLIDRVLLYNYGLYCYKLPNGQVLATICYYGDSVNCIPVKSVMSHDLRTAFVLLDASLELFNVSERYHNFNDAFYNDFAEKHTSSVEACKRRIKL